MNNLIAFITDFGADDAYVGIVKGVIKSINPKADIIDISHNVPMGDVSRAAFLLWQSVQYFPPQTIFLCVVDPGVGSKRAPLIIQCDENVFIGPNNGLFSYIIYKKQFSAWIISNKKYQLDEISNTFHGRDIFGPVAAYASLGVPLPNFGEVITNVVTLSMPKLILKENQIIGEILFFDRFGNGITSIGKIQISADSGWIFVPWIMENNLFQHSELAKLEIKVLSRGEYVPLRLVRTFSDVNPNQTAAIIGSSGLIEIVANCASAEKELSLHKGDEVILTW